MKNKEKMSWMDIVMPIWIVIITIYAGYSIYRMLTQKDIGESKFMMECVYDHFQTPENCKKILNGEDPPKLPFE